MQLEKANTKPNYLSTGTKIIPLKNKIGQKLTRRNEPVTETNANIVSQGGPEVKRPFRPTAQDTDLMNTTIHEIIKKQQEQIL